MSTTEKPNEKLKAIVRIFLEANGYDGLFSNSGECACENSDLMPCDEPSPDCEAGYKVPCNCSEGCKWHIARSKIRDKESPE